MESEAGSEAVDLSVLPDFSHLPDIVWVKILCHLDLADRSKVARTCYALNAVFVHPSLWHTVKITLLGTMSDSRREHTLILDRYFHMIERFGGYFQNLSLKVIGLFHNLPPRCKEVMQNLSRKCRLESLTLEVGIQRTRRHYFFDPNHHTGLEMIIDFISHAFRLKNFSLRAWPIEERTRGADILEALTCNEKLRKLEKLSLFWQKSEDSTTWVSQNVLMPITEQVLPLFQHFNNLRQIGLHACMLSDPVLQALCHSHHASVESLSILVSYNIQKLHGGIPDISPTSWSSLTAKHPRVTVNMTVVTRVPSYELALFLKPEIPLTTLEFMKYSQLYNEDLYSLAEKYTRSLTSFINFNDSENLDQGLKFLVSKCQILNEMTFFGPLNYKTVQTIASVRCDKWQLFKINGAAISYRGPPPLEDLDPDVLVVEVSPGKVELVEILKHRLLQEEEAHFPARREQMLDNVSKSLGYTWQPFDCSCS